MATKAIRTYTPFNPADHIGKKYGHWTVLRYVGMAGCHRILECRCKCGKLYKQDLPNLKNGRSTQCRKCGYKSGSIKQRTPFFGNQKYRNVYEAAKQRYTLCDEWQDPAKFIAWMKENHDPRHTLVALDPTQPLGPDNVWLSGSSAHKIRKLYRIAGREQTASEWEAELGVGRERVRQMANQANGRCQRCGRKSAGYALCLACQEKSRKRHRCGVNIRIHAARMIAEIEDQERPDGVPFGETGDN